MTSFEGETPTGESVDVIAEAAEVADAPEVVVAEPLDEVVDDVPVELVPEDPPPHAVSANSDAKSRGSCLMGEYLGCCSCGARTMSVYCGENVKSP